MNYFCGYPVDGKPCGKLATPGCAFCDEHGSVFDKYGVGDLLAMDTGTGPRPHPLTEEEIIQTAIERDHRNGRWLAIGAFLVLALVALYQPVHTWLHRHVELFAGILIGSLAEAVVWIACIWKRL
jgi:hypothetical protein